MRGRVVLYADKVTDSMFAAISETNRRRDIQLAYNEKNNIIPVSITKEVRGVIETLEAFSKEEGLAAKDVESLLDNKTANLPQAELVKLSKKL